MSRFAITFGLLLALAGCRGTEPAGPSSAEAPLVYPLRPAAAEPNDAQDGALEPAQTSGQPAQDETEAPIPQPSPVVPAEPNEPDPPEPIEKIDVTELVRLGEAPAVEPNRTPRPTPAAQDANEPPTAEGEAPAQVESLPLPEQDDPNESQPKEVEASEPEILAWFYEGYAKILEEYALADGRVNYMPLRRRRLALKNLLAIPDALDPNAYASWSTQEKLAFWINTYNIKMLDVIARNYPIESSMWLRLTWPPSDIRHIKGIWSDYRFIVMDEEFTLGEVERRIFRREFADPRVYLAITYASRSTPSLRLKPYRGRELDRQLDEQVKAFLSDEKAFRIDRREGIVYLSALFKPTWRGKEFVGRYGTDKKFKSYAPETRAVLNFLIHYLSTDDVYFLEVENYALKYINFDWRLNDTGKGY